MSSSQETKTRVAIVGSGVAGLAAFWALHRSSESMVKAHLYEKHDDFGGHVVSTRWEDTTASVDVAFSLFNKQTYPNFTKFLEELSIKTNATRITFGLHREKDHFEWSSASPRTLFPGWQSILNLERWNMLLGILKFNATAIEVLDPEYKYKNETIAQYVSRNQYPLAFQRLYLYPLLSCIWIHDPNEDVGAMPIIFVVQYLWNHRLLHTFTSPVIWQTIDGGARQYVSRILDKIDRAFVHKKSTVHKVIRRHDYMTLCLTDGQGRLLEEDFAHVVFATHPEEILEMLGGEATKQECEILRMSHMTAESEVVLHSDQTFIAQEKNMRSAWTFHDLDDPASSSSPLRVSLTADLKHILNLEKVAGLADKEILATMNPSPLKMPQNQFKSFKFKHPAYDALTMEAQARIDEIQGKDRVWYAGAWMGHGFHEDGFTRGIQAAKLLCAQLGRQFSPFPLRDWTKPVEQQLRDRLLRNAWGSVLGLIIRILALFVQ